MSPAPPSAVLDRLRLEPRVPLLVDASPSLHAAPSHPTLRVVSDGLVAPLYAGNTARKLEFLLEEARATGAKRLATIGAWGSNHCLATATHGHALGFDVALHQFPQPVTEHVRANLRAMHARGAELIPHLTPASAHLAWLAEKLRSDTFAIPGGGSSPSSVAGYALAVDTIAPLLASPPDEIVVAAGTCGTLAGIVLGVALQGWKRTVVRGIRVTHRIVANDRAVRRLLDQARTRYHISALPLPVWHLDGAWYAPGYGRQRASWPEVLDAARAFPDLTLEPTYTGRAFEAALAGSAEGRSVLYWHTLNQQPIEPLCTPVGLRTPLPPAYRDVFSPATPQPRSPHA
jgi:1-aminocyclopropane-1-carboxylate deaminase/D-cysteine desulfhydrase-like pyridoxal-dependent ACC family enzyme